MTNDRLTQALLEVYDSVSGPWFASLTEATRRTIIEVAHQRSTLGRGRVTDRRLDQRLKENRHGAATEQGEPTHD